jgi:hypothetical protein
VLAGVSGPPLYPKCSRELTSVNNSSSLQFISYITKKMSDTPYKNCPPSLHGGEIPYQRSHVTLLWHIETLSEQGPKSTADGISYHQGAGEFC